MFKSIKSYVFREMHFKWSFRIQQDTCFNVCCYFYRFISKVQLEWTRSEHSIKLCIGKKRAKPLCSDWCTCIRCFILYSEDANLWSVCNTKFISWNDEGKLSFIFKSDLAMQSTYSYSCLQNINVTANNFYWRMWINLIFTTYKEIYSNVCSVC